MTLDGAAPDQSVKILAVDWSALAEDEGRRLRALGVDEGAQVSIAHRGVFAGNDPIALQIGRMKIALRRMHAAAITVAPVKQGDAD